MPQLQELLRDETRPWRPGTSVCPTVPKFRTADTYPTRSPLLLADYVIAAAKRHSAGNVVEVGTRNGDLSACIDHFVNKFTAVEMDESYCRSLRKRGLTVLCKDWHKVDMDEDIPGPVDVVFWFCWPPTLSEPWLRRLWEWRLQPRAAGKRARNTTVLISFDGHVPEDMRYMPLLVAQYRGEVDRVFFDEGGAITSRSEPSYGHAKLWRPGRWGVLHVAKFELGPASGPLPPPLRADVVDKIFRNVRTDWSWPDFGWTAGEPPPDRNTKGACKVHDDCQKVWGSGCAPDHRVLGCAWCTDTLACEPCIAWDPKDPTASVDGKYPNRCHQVAHHHRVHEERVARHANRTKGDGGL